MFVVSPGDDSFWSVFLLPTEVALAYVWCAVRLHATGITRCAHGSRAGSPGDPVVLLVSGDFEPGPEAIPGAVRCNFWCLFIFLILGIPARQHDGADSAQLR